MKKYLQVCLTVVALGISSISVNAMEKVSAPKTNANSSSEKVANVNSLSRSRTVPVDSVALGNDDFNDNYSINLSSTDKVTSLQNGVRNDYTKIWKESVGEPENNSLQITLLRF